MRGWRRIGKWLLFLLLCSAGWHVGSSTTCAAGANVFVTTDVNPVVKGDIFYVMVTVTSTEEMSGFEGYFSYNQSVMKYMTGGSVSSGNDDVFSISDTDRETSSSTLKYSIQFKARRSGSSTVELKSPYTVYSALTSEKMSVAYNSMNIRVLSKKQAEKQQAAGVEGTGNPSGNEDGEDSPTDNPAEEISGTGEDGDNPEDASGTDSPQVTAPAAGNGKGWSGGSGSSPGLGQQPQIRTAETDEPDGQNMLQEKEGFRDFSGKGLSRGICIVVIVIASLGLVFLGIAFVSMWRNPSEEMEEEDSGDREVTEEELYSHWQEGSEGMPDWQDEIGQDSHTEEKEQESLEMIEKRLEQKRRWLRRDDL